MIIVSIQENKLDLFTKITETMQKLLEMFNETTFYNVLRHYSMENATYSFGNIYFFFRISR